MATNYAGSTRWSAAPAASGGNNPIGTAPPWLRRRSAGQAGGMGDDWDTAFGRLRSGNAGTTVNGSTGAYDPTARMTQFAGGQQGDYAQGATSTTASAGSAPSPGGTFASFYKDDQDRIFNKYRAGIASNDPATKDAAMKAWRAELDALANHASSAGGGGEIAPGGLHTFDANGNIVYTTANTSAGANPGNAVALPPPGGFGAGAGGAGGGSFTGTASPPSAGPDPMAANGGWGAFDPGLDRTSVDYNGLPDLDQDFSGAAAKGADAAYKAATAFFDKDFGNDRAALETQLLNQGFARGTQGFDDAMEKLTRGQNAAREHAAFQAQGVGHQQAGDFLTRALAARGALVGERERRADRTFGQSATAANLRLAGRGQDLSRYSIDKGAETSKYGIDANTALALRRLGLDEDSQGVQQLLALIASSRGGVNMPNFGGTQPLDVAGANSIASSNANAAANRSAANRAALYQLGGAALGGINWADLFK